MENNRQKPASHLAWAIVSTVLFFIPFGIVAIVFASKVEGLWNRGLYEEAYKASASAKKWALASTILGAILNAIFITLWIILLCEESSSYYDYYDYYYY